jgi:pimeloyl-ACP methyl ester carboxylesterase
MPRPLAVGIGTTAYWARNPERKLILFVHGFNGRAVTTWSQFSSLLQQHHRCRGCDVLFYGYNGTKTRALPSAALFYDFLDRFATSPTNLINESLPPGVAPRNDSFAYDRIIIVAHSLGAIIARQALLFAVVKKREWREIARLLLFAPAHKGSDIIAMSGSILGMFRPLSPDGVAALMEFAFPVLKDLHDKSKTWQTLETQCLANIPPHFKPGDDHPLIALDVILGDADRVVHPDVFGKDPSIPKVLPGSHTIICKPHSSFLEPLQFLAQVL